MAATSPSEASSICQPAMMHEPSLNSIAVFVQDWRENQRPSGSHRSSSSLSSSQDSGPGRPVLQTMDALKVNTIGFTSGLEDLVLSN